MDNDTPATVSQFEIELDEQPHCPRPDVRSLNFRCDENGDLKHEPSKLENRGTTAHAELFSKATAHKLSVVAKLRETGRADLADPLAECHTIDELPGLRQLPDRRRLPEPMRAPLLSRVCAPARPGKARVGRVVGPGNQGAEARRPDDPQHRRADQGPRSLVQEVPAETPQAQVRTQLAGRFLQVEVTNESKGWHLHAHLLVDAGWISGAKLATEWAKVVGQELAIVKVKDVHSRDYLAEVTKYTVKGSQLATWTGTEIAEFVDAFDGVRTFGVFGSLYGKRTEWAEWIKTLREQGPVCACGCHHFRILSPQEFAWENLRRESGVWPTQPGAPDQEPLLPNLPIDPERPQQHWKGQL